MMTTALATSPTNADTKLASQRITANGSANNHRSWTAMLGLFASQPALAGFELFKKTRGRDVPNVLLRVFFLRCLVVGHHRSGKNEKYLLAAGFLPHHSFVAAGSLLFQPAAPAEHVVVQLSCLV